MDWEWESVHLCPEMHLILYLGTLYETDLFAIYEGPLYFFRDAWLAIFALREAWMRIFSVIRESIFFRPRETVFDFSVIREICIYFRVICEPTTFARIIFHFFGEFL